MQFVSDKPFPEFASVALVARISVGCQAGLGIQQEAKPISISHHFGGEFEMLHLPRSDRLVFLHQFGWEINLRRTAPHPGSVGRCL
jgi:hypothetical protein